VPRRVCRQTLWLTTATTNHTGTPVPFLSLSFLHFLLSLHLYIFSQIFLSPWPFGLDWWILKAGMLRWHEVVWILYIVCKSKRSVDIDEDQSLNTLLGVSKSHFMRCPISEKFIFGERSGWNTPASNQVWQAGRQSATCKALLEELLLGLWNRFIKTKDFKITLAYAAWFKNSVGLKKTGRQLFQFFAPEILADFSNELAKIGHDWYSSKYVRIIEPCYGGSLTFHFSNLVLYCAALWNLFLT
jgi:hypothetical protein